MKKVLKNTPRTKKYLEKLPKVYALCLWAKWTVVECYWSGKFNKEDKPLIYLYFDQNGECDEYRLVPINYVSCGFHSWHSDKDTAEFFRKIYNKRLNNG